VLVDDILGTQTIGCVRGLTAAAMPAENNPDKAGRSAARESVVPAVENLHGGFVRLSASVYASMAGRIHAINGGCPIRSHTSWSNRPPRESQQFV